MLPDKVLLRPGKAADLWAITAIERAASAGPWTLSQLVSTGLRDGNEVLVAESPEGEVVGFAVTQQLVDEATLLNIAVDPAMQGRGYGRALLESVIDALSGSGTRRLLLEVRAGNARAIDLYRRSGFVDDGRRRGYYAGANGREDAILMSLDLETRSERVGN